MLSQTHIDERVRDSRRIVIDELISEMYIINGAKTLYCEAVGSLDQKYLRARRL